VILQFILYVKTHVNKVQLLLFVNVSTKSCSRNCPSPYKSILA